MTKFKIYPILKGCKIKATRRRKDAMSRGTLETWLRDAHFYNRPTDPFEAAVTQGLAAQETIAAKIRDFFLLGEPETPKWLKTWVSSLTTKEVEAIETKLSAERATLREYIERLVSDDPADWTETDRTRAAELGRRISAATLVLRARKEAEDGEGLDATTFLPAPAV